MVTIVTRAGKGSPLTNTEVDANFTNLSGGLSPLAKAIRVALLASASVRTLQVLDDADIDMGTNNFSVVVQKRITTTRPAANEILYHKHDGTTGVIVTLLTTGIVRLTLNATNFDSTTALTSASNVEPLIIIPVTRSSASAAGSVIFVVDGVQIGASVAISVGAPASVDNSSNLFLLGTSTTTTEGAYYDGAIYNRALSVTECLNYCLRGPDRADLTASQTAEYTSDFSVDTNGFTASFGTATGNVDGIDGVNNVLQYSCTSAGVGRRVQRSMGFTQGLRYSLAISVNFPVGNANADSFIICNESGVALASTTFAQNVTKGVWLSYVFDFVAEVTASTMRIYTGATASTTASTSSGDIMYMVGIEQKRIGATGHWPAFNAQTNTGQLADRSGNKNHMLLPASGATILGDRRPDVQLTWDNTWAATSELQYFPGVNQACYPVNFYIEGIILTPSATTTAGFTIGNGSNAAYYATVSGPLTAGVPVFVPLTNRYPDGTNLKLTITPMATTTCTLATTVFGRLLGGF